MKGKKITFTIPKETNKTGVVMDKVRVSSYMDKANFDKYLINVNGAAYLIEPHQILSFE